jgi:hypothetical protein
MNGDLFDGTFDNQATQRREVWKDGKPGRYASRNCTGDPGAYWKELRDPWGTYPDVPSNQSKTD